MTEPVLFTERRDAEFYARLPRAEEVDLPAINSMAVPAQVCRTCIHGDNKLWGSTLNEQIVYVANGGKLEDLMCEPTKPWGAYRVLNQTDHRGRLKSLDYTGPVQTRAIVETCGYEARRDCNGCDRFDPVQTEVFFTNSPTGTVRFRTIERGSKIETVPYTDDDSPVRRWKVTIGGKCTIPTEGILVNGVKKTCDWVARKKRVESPSCANCLFLDYKGDSWQFHHLEVNDNARLTPWESQQIDPEEQGLALWHKQVYGNAMLDGLHDTFFGRRYWYRARLLETADRNGRKIYTVRFMDSMKEAIIAEGDDRFLIHELEDHGFVGVEIAYPYNNLFNLDMPTRKRNRIWPKLPENGLVIDNKADFVNPVCQACRPGKACYYHSKGPATSPVTGLVSFYQPEGRISEFVPPAHGVMRVVKRHGEIVAVDGNGNLPIPYGEDVANASVFRKYFDSLTEMARMRFGQKGVKAIRLQYIRIVGELQLTPKPVTMRPAWLHSSTIEPNKAYCSHPNGPNLRKVFQDSFGQERVDWEFDHGSMTTDQVEEEFRVGYRQHMQTPQRLQEEILAAEGTHPRYDPASGGLKPLENPVPTPTNVEVHVIPAIGGMYRDDGSPVTSTAEFVDGLDSEVIVGMSGEVDRKISKRQQLFGYAMSRGFYGSRSGSDKTSMPAADSLLAIFNVEDVDPDQIDITDAWHCVECDIDYDHSEIENFFDPRCERCESALYKNHTTRMTYNPRDKGGVGNAYVMDSFYAQNQRRLYTTLCPNWRLNTGSSGVIISLDDIHGPSSSIPAGAHATVKDERMKTVTVGVLNEEHKKRNREYDALYQEVVDQREAHMDEYPDTSEEELHRLYPTPRGTVYRPKAEGSLAKMGSV